MSLTTAFRTGIAPTPREYREVYQFLVQRPDDVPARTAAEVAFLPAEAAAIAAAAVQRWGDTPMTQAHHRAVLAAAIRPHQHALGRGVGTGAGGGDDRAVAAEATSWVNRSTDYPEAPAQAHPSTVRPHQHAMEASA